MILTGCGAINESIEPCPEVEPPLAEIRFSFTQNMDFVDEFTENVHCLDLYVFNHGGKLVYEYHEERDDSKVQGEDIVHKISLDPGYYDAVVYGGMSCSKSSFSFIKDVSNVINFQELAVTLKKDFYLDFDESNDIEGTGEENDMLEIHDHFYGLKENFNVDEGTATVFIDLERNTNRINVKLCKEDNSLIDVNNYSLYITDDNITMDCYNNLTPSGLIAYRPIYNFNLTENGFPKTSSSFVVSKLYKNDGGNYNETTPKLTVIDKRQGKDRPIVDRLGLMPYLLASKDGYINATGMSNEEFLRRNFEWNIELRLDVDEDRWVELTVSVDKWKVRFENISFEGIQQDLK